jgi:hypothetical protein
MIENLRALLERTSDRLVARTEKNDDPKGQLARSGDDDDEEEGDRAVCLEETHQKNP